MPSCSALLMLSFISENFISCNEKSSFAQGYQEFASIESSVTTKVRKCSLNQENKYKFF